ncbi:hypothetical protein UM93_09120 [Psychromicrobium lacuslunae]|uniref:Uncharacterized protein n=1 Tax=Psychromicrobium lacuslunae TaxID=1618207 RepID=A0A0D4C3R0_9MICC|nr:hypothetical protein UM93_09120 [Psychromicrobium lacuslunae]
MILAIAVVLWLIWVGPYVLRLRKVRIAAAAEDFSENLAANSSAVRLMESTKAQPREAAMTARTTSATTEQTSQPKPKAAQAAAPARLKLRYDRVALAGVGVVALLTALVTVLLKAFNLGSIWLPVIAALVFVASVVGLRFLAINDRKKRVEKAFRAAMGNQPIVATKPVPAATPVKEVAKETKLFDAQPPVEEPQQLAKKLSPAQLREAALAVSQGAEVKADGTWEPVAVPKPAYVEAAKAERPSPAPLDLPEAPKAAAKTSIKQSEAGVKPAEPAARSGEAVSAAKPERAGAALNNLDDVLQRRRA